MRRGCMQRVWTTGLTVACKVGNKECSKLQCFATARRRADISARYCKLPRAKSY
jgi:hypothetical protein